MKGKERVNKPQIEVDHGGDAFYSDSITITFNRSKFILDFKQSIPRMDRIGNTDRQTIVTRHNVVIIDAGFAKIFSKTLNATIKKYESRFGKPSPEKTEKKGEEEKKGDESYIG